MESRTGHPAGGSAEMPPPPDEEAIMGRQADPGPPTGNRRSAVSAMARLRRPRKSLRPARAKCAHSDPHHLPLTFRKRAAASLVSSAVRSCCPRSNLHSTTLSFGPYGWEGDQFPGSVGPADRRGQDTETIHGTQKPVECMRRPMLNNSSPGQAIYEPFLGSGTTLIAAQTLGRSCFAIELDPLYVDVAIRRWQAFTGDSATLLEDGRRFDAVAAERTATGRQPSAKPE